MIRFIGLLWLLWLGGEALTAQVASVHASPIVKDFFLDPVGKVYFLLTDDQLVTYNRLGNNTYSFFDSSLGAPDYVDVTNPFQILVYYQDYGTVIVLDRTLNELDRIDLFAKDFIEQPGAIARSYDNGLWVFDNWAYRLLRIDDRGAVDQQTNNLRLELNEPGEPTAIYVDRNAVVLHFPDVNRLAVFSNFGEFQRWVELPAATNLSWYAPRLLGLTEAVAWVWNVRGGAPVAIEHPPAELFVGPRARAGKLGFYWTAPGGLELKHEMYEK